MKNRSNKLAVALLACLLAAPALAEEVGEAYGGGYEKRHRQERMDTAKARHHEHSAAMSSIQAELDRCVDAATTVDAMKACHLKAREARKAHVTEQRQQRAGDRQERMEKMKAMKEQRAGLREKMKMHMQHTAPQD